MFLQKVVPTYFSTFQNRRLGSILLSKIRGVVADGSGLVSMKFVTTNNVNTRPLSNLCYPKRRLGNVEKDEGEVFCKQFYAPQTKILEGRTNISECVFEALFKGESARFGLHNVKKCFENAL